MASLYREWKHWNDGSFPFSSSQFYVERNLREKPLIFWELKNKKEFGYLTANTIKSNANGSPGQWFAGSITISLFLPLKTKWWTVLNFSNGYFKIKKKIGKSKSICKEMGYYYLKCQREDGKVWVMFDCFRFSLKLALIGHLNFSVRIYMHKG